MKRAFFAILPAFVFSLAAAACGDSGTTTPIDGAVTVDGATVIDSSTPMPDAQAVDAQAIDGATTTFALTSTAFAPGATIPAAHTCAGTNLSPRLEWNAGPAGTLSYAIVFTDTNNSLIHSIIYDIPASARFLPENVMKTAMPTIPGVPDGAKQVRAYDGSTFGYLGPCPGASVHTYEFAIYALNVATLGGGITTQSARPATRTAIIAAMVGSATLRGMARTN